MVGIENYELLIKYKETKDQRYYNEYIKGIDVFINKKVSAYLRRFYIKEPDNKCELINEVLLSIHNLSMKIDISKIKRDFGFTSYVNWYILSACNTWLRNQYRTVKLPSCYYSKESEEKRKKANDSFLHINEIPFDCKQEDTYKLNDLNRTIIKILRNSDISEVNQRIFYLWLYGRKTYKEIGSKYNLTKQRVEQIIKFVRQKLIAEDEIIEYRKIG